jgi:hypothetical protein
LIGRLRIFDSNLYAHSDDNPAEIMTNQHADECLRRFLQTIDEVLANAAIGDAGTDLAQEGAARFGLHPDGNGLNFCGVCASRERPWRDGIRY